MRINGLTRNKMPKDASFHIFYSAPNWDEVSLHHNLKSTFEKSACSRGNKRLHRKLA